MIIVMKPNAKSTEISRILEEVENLGLKYHLSKGKEKTIIGLLAKRSTLSPEHFEVFSGVEEVVRVSKPYKLTCREFHPEKSIIRIDGVNFGEQSIVVMAGPCAVESQEQILESAFIVKEAGAKILRGGAFKPRTSPYSFQGLKEQGLEFLAEAKAQTGLLIVTELISPEHVHLVSQVADILQIGTRNMHNYALLEAVGNCKKPVLLKRGMMATLEEFLMAAEYILSQGNSKVILCERGIRTFEKYTRNTLDIAAVPLLNQLTHLPICVDPSHGTGKRELILPVSRAAVAAGTDSLIVEVHPNPETALSDGGQSLDAKEFTQFMCDLKPIAKAMNRSMG